MKKKRSISTRRRLLRSLATTALVTAAMASAVPAWAGPKGTILVRALGDKQLTIDGDISDWPLDKFKKVAEQPVFPAGQNAESTSASGDHLVFDTTRIGRFNGTGEDAFKANDNDFGVTTYFAYDVKYLYILSVCIDDTLRDDKDTTQYGSSGFLNDGFEFFLDAKGDSTDCIADVAFPAVDTEEPNVDDLQVTVAINSTFKPQGSGAAILGGRQTVERSGNPDLVGPEKGGPGGHYRDELDKIGPDIGARKYDDLRAAGARNPEIAAKPNVKFSGYAIEMRIPLRGKILPDLKSGHDIGFELFWRDVDAEDDPGKGGGDISWASWAQSTDVPCTDPKIALFNSANWGKLSFDSADPLVPIPAGKPTVLFVSSDVTTAPNADGDLVEFIQANGFGVVMFNAGGSTPEGLREAAAGKSVVFISETIGSTSVVDPPGAGTGVFSLQDTDVPVISAEAYMYDNADWVKRSEDGSNDFTQWGNTSRAENVDTPIGDGKDSLHIRKADHPIAQGFTGKVKVYKELYSLNYGLATADADVVASVQPDGTYPTIFVYEKGDKLWDGSVVPNKRIGIYIGQNAAPDFNTTLDLNNVTSEGRALFINTLKYAAGVGSGTVPDGNLTGLAGYWRMNETAGDVVADDSGKGNNGKVVNNTAGSWVMDADRGAVYRSTGTNVINFGALIPPMTTAKDFAWSLWIKSDETGTAAAPNNNIVFGNRYNASGADFNPREFIKFTPSNFEWHFNGGGQNVNYTDFVVGKWTHHLVVKKGATLTYYRDGTEASTGAVTGGPTNTQPLYLGGQGTQERWRGYADEVAIFDRALSAAEAKQVYDLGMAGKPLAPAPLKVSSASLAGGNLTITWTGGNPPFKVQRTAALGSAWTDAITTNDRTATVPATGNAGFIRVVGQ